MFNSMKYSAIRALRDKEFMFSAVVLAILMGTVQFFMTNTIMDDLMEGSLEVPVAIVEVAGSEESVFVDILEATGMFELTFYDDLDNIMYQLEDNTVAGIFEVAEVPRLIVSNNGVSQMLMQAVADEYIIGHEMLMRIATENPEYLEAAVAQLMTTSSVMAEMEIAENQVDLMQFIIIMMLTLPAMSGMFLGLERAVLTNNDGEKASRRIISSFGKWRILIADLLGSAFVVLINTLIVWAWFALALGVDLGVNLMLAGLTFLVISLFSLSFGAAFGLLAPGGRKTREQILTGAYMAMFMFGFMGSQMQNETIRLINQFNPMTATIDALMALNMGSYGRYVGFMSILAGAAVICLILTSVALRRNRHVDVR